jgi:hypothetical protein
MVTSLREDGLAVVIFVDDQSRRHALVVLVGNRSATAKLKFFGSFFQKRTASFLSFFP